MTTKLFLKQLVAIVWTLLVGCSKQDIATQAVAEGPRPACLIGEQLDGYYNPIKEDVVLFQKPSKSSTKVVNQQATKMLGKKTYRTLDPAYTLRAECKFKDWIFGQIVKADERDVSWEKGWIESKLANSPSLDSRPKNLPAKNHRECVAKGIAYFASIGPTRILSDGRKSDEVAGERCYRTLSAFDSSND